MLLLHLQPDVNKVKADGGSKCTTGGAERFSQHTKGRLMVFICPAVWRRHGAKP